LQETLLAYNQTKDTGENMPFFIFDKDTGLIYLNAPESTFNDDTEDVVFIYLNKPLYRLAPGGRGCAKNLAKRFLLVALLVLKKRVSSEAL
jgi:hypothetical protein